MSKSILTNYIFNLINTLSAILFPLITFPYASRVLLADGLGEIHFYQSLISYIVLVVGLGIPLYAVSEIAKVQNNTSSLNTTAFEILLLHSILTIVGYLVVGVFAISVPKIQENLPLFFLLSTSILLTTIGCEWFYKGVEDFKYITIRGLVFRIISVILLFLFVKTKEDVLIYALTSTLTSVGSNVFNFYRLRKYLSFKAVKLSNLRPFRHLKSAGVVFMLILISTIYITLNPVILGFMTHDACVGYYHGGVKLFALVFGVIDSLTVILIPRFSNLLSEGKEQEFAEILRKVYRFTIGIGLPMSVGLFFVSQYAIPLLGGESFLPAIGVSQVLAFLIIFVGLSNVFGMQTLYPKGKIRIMVISTILACATDLLVCYIAIPVYEHIGAALGYLSAEVVACASLYLMGRKYIPLKLYDKSIFHYLGATVLMALSLYAVSFIKLMDFMMCIVMIAVGAIIYIGFLLAIKDSLIVQTASILKNKYSRV